MKSKIASTKKDLVVILICIAFLIANIAAIGEGGRKRAKSTVCLSNLYKWGQIFQAYTADNDGFFHSRDLGTPFGYSRMWQYIYKPYYIDKMMRFCPTADNPMIDTGTFGTWNYTEGGSYYPMNDPILYMPGEREFEKRANEVTEGFFTGSYGMNRYVEDMKGGTFGTSTAFWRRTDVKGGEKAPLLMDCQYLYFWDTTNGTADPPKYDGDFTTPEMHWVCINRHSGFINACFLDFSARKVGLKELWTLKHSRNYDTCGPWTICGFGGNKAACHSAWHYAAPWMDKMPEY
jgi:hypothetical protein